MIVVLVIIMLASATQSLQPRTRTQTAYAHTIDRYIGTLEADLPRVAYIAGFRSLIGLEEHISATGQYLPDVDAAFEEMFTNGTANGTFFGIMNASTFTNFTSRFMVLAAKQGMRANLTLLSINAYHETPWEVTLNFTVFMRVEDTSGSIAFSRNLTTQAVIPIIDVKDPVYTIGTQGRAPHSIAQSNLSRPLITATNDTSKLQTIVNETLYVESVNAPSFLQRFEGNFSPSPNGIVSLVDIAELRTQGLPVDQCKSVVDFKYFGPVDTDPNHEIVNMDPNDFWLGDGDLADFDAAGKEVGFVSCP